MTDDAKQAAWRRFCEQLEALGVDPYSPDVPEDDPRHEQVQAILAEYEAATTVKPALPPDWEGHQPTEDVSTLPGLANWLGFQWSLIKGWELAGDKAKPGALRDAAKAIRNAFRVLVWLGVNDRPERPLPPDTLEEAKRQIDQLQRWVREKHNSGWKPTPQPAQPQAAPKVAKTGQKRSEVVPDDVADLRIEAFLKEHPKATAKQVAKAVGIAQGRVPKMASWRAEMGRRKAAKQPAKAKQRPLTKKMLAAAEAGDDPAQIAEAREAAWQRVIEEADEERRAELHALSREQRDMLIDAALEHFADRLAEEGDCS